MSNNIAQAVSRLLVYATLVSVTIVHAPASRGQDPDIKKQLQGVDLEGVQQLRLSPNGELAAGLTKLYANPGYGSGSFSLVKVWSVKEKQLLHEFRIRGAVYEAVFSPDSSTLVTADKTGNLGPATTIRAWNLQDGSEHQGGGRFPGLSDKFCFSPDGNRLAAIQYPEYSWLNPLGEYEFKLNVWQVTKSGGLSINIPNALGDHRATIPSGKIDGVAMSEERGRKILAQVTPVLRGFSEDGKQLICDFDAGPRAFDARTGRIMQRPKICTVGLFKSMLMIAPQQVPADVKSLTIEIPPHEKPFRLERAADGWWRLRQAKRFEFRVSDRHFVVRKGDVETKQEIRMLLGLKDDSSLADLSSLKHPVGIIKIDRDATRLKFRLEEVTDGTESGETLQTGEVRWAPTIRESKNEGADRASDLPNTRAIIEAGRDAKSMPAGTVVRLHANAISAATDAKETSTRIAVSVLDKERGGIYVLNADGSGKQRLTTGRSDMLPRWSPDGKQIAFLALREQDQELAAVHDLAFHWFLYVMDADGQNQRRVTKTPIGMIFQWSPNGTQFVFQSSCEDVKNKAKDGAASSTIYVMNLDGTQQKRLTPVENDDGFPSWSPDGKRIAFCSNRHGNKDIFVMNADGSDVRRLTSNEANDSVPTWSPDGKQIAFTSLRKSETACVVNANGTQETALAVRGRPVAWSPDGQSLLIENDGQLVFTGADGRNPKELTQEGKPALDGEYSPDGKAVFYRSKMDETWTLMSVDMERLSLDHIWNAPGKLLGFSICEKKSN
ncbi:MAG: DPP IV N-terminal domain-containing protein [Rubripirellula sp.]|nr:DPP IV N-terminal domain-containing protein [Rubripirellula sp.]